MEWLRTLVICWVTILVLTLTHGVVAARTIRFHHGTTEL